MDETRDPYAAFMLKYLEGKTEAILWLMAYNIYVHAIDDLIDRDWKSDTTREELLLKTFEFAAVVYSNPFYINNIQHLYPLVKMASNTYMDSVQFEKSSEQWKRHFADILRTMGNEIILAVIELYNGIDSRRQASIELREISYKLHHNSDGTPR